MSDLISSCSWEDFKKVVEAGKVGELQSCEILLPDHDFTVIIFHGDAFARDYARTQAEYLAQRTNSVAGKTPAELMGEIDGKPKTDLHECPTCGFSAKSKFGLRSHMRKHAKELAGVA